MVFKKIEKIHKYLVIGGEYYAISHIDGKPDFTKISKKTIEKIEKKVDKIAEELKRNLDSKAVLKEAIFNLEEKEIDKLYNSVFKSKQKYKPKTREHHCVDMKIGNFVLPIVE